MTIHREGYSLLFISLLVLFGLNYLVYSQWPEATVLQNSVIGISIILYLIILQFFRNPIFDISRNDNSVLAPADGKVVVIEETVETEYLNSRRRQISIFMSPVNVHVNRMPV